MTLQTTETQAAPTTSRRDLHQQVTDTIIQQLEEGTVPWLQPWKGNTGRFSIPKNATTGNKYKGINILLLWSAAVRQNYPTQEWGSFKQWQANKEMVRKGEKGNLIVYYDTLEREVDGKVQEIPFLKSSVVFNRSQLTSYQKQENAVDIYAPSLIERLGDVDRFVLRTEAVIVHRDYTAGYMPSTDKILMPVPEAFVQTENATATEGYYSTLLHELTHWTGHKTRLNRTDHKKFGDKNYATEELVAELGAAFLCAEFDITTPAKPNHAGYIANWLQVLKNNKHCIFTAASEASKSCGYLTKLQKE